MIKEADRILQYKIVNNILTKCETVICFRTTPEEKAQLIHLVKTHKKVITMAIGDGSNDVNMLMEANVSVAL
jgi:P-type E1-E2 ATPase